MSNSSQETLENISPWYNRWLISKFAIYLKGDILEVGTGIGNFTNMFNEYGKVISIDVDDNYLKITKKNVSEDVKLGFGDIEKGEYFFKSRKFTTIVCLNVLEHIKDDKKALKNLFDLLEPGGKLILLVPMHQFLFGDIDQAIGHYRRYQSNELRQKLTLSGFKIIRYKNLSFIGIIGWFIASKILKNKTVTKSKMKLFNFLAPLFLKLEDFIHPPVGLSALVISTKD